MDAPMDRTASPDALEGRVAALMTIQTKLVGGTLATPHLRKLWRGRLSNFET